MALHITPGTRHDIYRAILIQILINGRLMHAWGLPHKFLRMWDRIEPGDVIVIVNNREPVWYAVVLDKMLIEGDPWGNGRNWQYGLRLSEPTQAWWLRYQRLAEVFRRTTFCTCIINIMKGEGSS